jgi:hypothetical protein
MTVLEDLRYATISDGNIKLGDIPNVSMTPGKSCGNCAHCHHRKGCYALRPYSRHPKTKKAWDYNYASALDNPVLFWSYIGDWICERQPDRFRVHVGGDILSQRYLDCMYEAVDENPKTRFLCFTKMFDFDYGGKPNNIQILFSMWPGMPVPDGHAGFRYAWVQDGTEKRIPKTAKKCSGSCVDCDTCFEPGEFDVWFMLH